METNHDAASQVKRRATSPAHETVSNPIASASAQSTYCRVHLMVVPVRIYGNDKSSFIDTCCMLNGGSKISLCTKSLLQKLQVRGQPMTKTISGVNGMQTQHGYSATIAVRGVNATNAISVSNVFAIDDLPKFGDSISRDEDVSMFEHQVGHRFAEVSSGQVELLTGAAIPAAQGVNETRLRALWKLAWVGLCLVRTSIWSLAKVKAKLRHVSLVMNNAIYKDSCYLTKNLPMNRVLTQHCRWMTKLFWIK